jgi:hypothetical protein
VKAARRCISAGFFLILILCLLSNCVDYPGELSRKSKQDYVYCFYSPFHRRLTTEEKDNLHLMWADYAAKKSVSDFLMEYDRTPDPDQKDIEAFDAMLHAEWAIGDKMTELFGPKKEGVKK